jgi:hypothetical protein
MGRWRPTREQVVALVGQDKLAPPDRSGFYYTWRDSNSSPKPPYLERSYTKSAPSGGAKSGADSADDATRRSEMSGAGHLPQFDPHPAPAPAQSSRWETMDPNLSRVVEAWPALPEPIRRAVLAVIAAGTGDSESR